MPPGVKSPHLLLLRRTSNQLVIEMPGRVPVRQGHHFGVSLNPRPLRAIAKIHFVPKNTATITEWWNG
jgi:hypothetical protein